MLVQLNEWGNSLGIRIPKKYRELLGLHKGTKVEILLKDRSIIVTPINESSALEEMAKEINLDEMVNRITPENRHAETLIEDFPAGTEVW